MLLDADVVAASPSSVYRVLKAAGLLERHNVRPSLKGKGFVQPLRPHEHWHVDVSYLNIGGTFYFLCSILDGCSRYIVHWEIRPTMREGEVETIIQRAREQYPGVTPRIISDNGPQFIAKDFKEFVRVCGMTHVKTSPYYPQSNGKIERWHRTIKGDCIRTQTPLSLEDAQRLVAGYVGYYNRTRLHSAIGYVTPKDKLDGKEKAIFAERDGKLEAARETGAGGVRRPRAAAARLLCRGDRLISSEVGVGEAMERLEVVERLLLLLLLLRGQRVRVRGVLLDPFIEFVAVSFEIVVEFFRFLLESVGRNAALQIFQRRRVTSQLVPPDSHRFDVLADLLRVYVGPGRLSAPPVGAWGSGPGPGGGAAFGGDSSQISIPEGCTQTAGTPEDLSTNPLARRPSGVTSGELVTWMSRSGLPGRSAYSRNLRAKPTVKYVDIHQMTCDFSAAWRPFHCRIASFGDKASFFSWASRSSETVPPVARARRPRT
jgi:hypothetical protein